MRAHLYILVLIHVIRMAIGSNESPLSTQHEIASFDLKYQVTTGHRLHFSPDIDTGIAALALAIGDLEIEARTWMQRLKH